MKKRITWLLLLLALLSVFLLSGCDGCSGDDFCPIPNGAQLELELELELEGDAGA